MLAAAGAGAWSWNFITGESLWSDDAYRLFGVPRGTPLSREAG